jgi:predicted XRE-type DNA-binding protein
MNEDFAENEDFEIIRGSGNVFYDFAYANADLEQARAILAKEIIHTLDDRGLSTREAEKLTGVAHSEFSRIRNAKLSRFTLDRMITIFGKLVENVEINLSFRPRHHAESHGLWLNIPKSLHSSLAKNAVQEGVPLDTWVLTLLSEKTNASSVVSQFEDFTEVVKTESTLIKELIIQANTAGAIFASKTIVGVTAPYLHDLSCLRPFDQVITIGNC